MIVLLTILTLASGITAIIFRQKNKLRYYGFFKPLTTSLIIVIALFIYHDVQSVYTKILIIALVFSLIGDVFLIGESHFLQGLSAFFIAHVGFSIAFISLFGFNRNLFTLIPLLFIVSTYFFFLKRSLNHYTLPVIIYMSVIVIMNWQAINLLTHNSSLSLWTIASAAILFSFSDAILAFNKFKRPFKLAQPIILSTYWIAIYLFTLSGNYLACL